MCEAYPPSSDGAGLDERLKEQLDAIERERVPERLLALARQLQELLRKRAGGRGNDAA